MKKGSFKNKIPNQSINSLNMLLYALDSSILIAFILFIEQLIMMPTNWEH